MSMPRAATSVATNTSMPPVRKRCLERLLACQLSEITSTAPTAKPRSVNSSATQTAWCG